VATTAAIAGAPDSARPSPLLVEGDRGKWGEEENIFSAWVMSISMTMLQYLMSTMALSESSSGRNSVGPKQTPRLLTVIKFDWLFAATLECNGMMSLHSSERYSTLTYA
jgi:hypothetical protein